MTNGLLIYGEKFAHSSYIRKPFLIYDFATAPLWISLYMRKIWFSYLSVYRRANKMKEAHAFSSVVLLVSSQRGSQRDVIYWGWPIEPQGKQSARLSVQLSELVPPPPLPQTSVAPPLLVQGGRHSRGGRASGGTPFQRRDRHSSTQEIQETIKN